MPRSTSQNHSTPLRFPNPMSGVRPVAPRPSSLHPVPTTPPSLASGVSAPSLGTIVKEGFAFGVGNAAAHRVFSSLFGPSQATGIPSHSALPPPPCATELSALDACIQSRTIEDHCNDQQLRYSQCLRLTR